MDCKEVRCRVLEDTLEDEAMPVGGDLGRHMQACPTCRSFLARLSVVDAALHDPPLQATPAHVSQRVLEQISPPPARQEKFLPWTMWLPIVSLVVGLFWAYLALLWQRGSELTQSLDPTLTSWLAQLEQWLGSNQSTLSAVGLSVAVGLLFTLVAVILGLYVGRSRTAIGH